MYDFKMEARFEIRVHAESLHQVVSEKHQMMLQIGVGRI